MLEGVRGSSPENPQAVSSVGYWPLPPSPIHSIRRNPRRECSYLGAHEPWGISTSPFPSSLWSRRPICIPSAETWAPLFRPMRGQFMSSSLAVAQWPLLHHVSMQSSSLHPPSRLAYQGAELRAVEDIAPRPYSTSAVASGALSELTANRERCSSSLLRLFSQLNGHPSQK